MDRVAPPFHLQQQQYVAVPNPKTGQCPQFLGKGQYSVWLYTDTAARTPSDSQVAIKRIDLMVQDAEKAKVLDRDLERELRIHHKLNHPLIVKMLDVFISEDGYLNIVLEYVKDGTLFSLINSGHANSEAVVRYFFQQLICTLDYLHAKNVVHRDIKLENTLCKAMQADGGKQLPPYGSWLLKVADFGLSRTGEAAGTEVGTEQYKAPEVYEFNNKGSSNAQNGSNAAHGNNNAQDGQHSGQNNPKKPRYASAPVDVWSAGVLLYAALNRVYPFNTRKDMNEEDVNRNLRGPRPLKYHQVLSHDCVDLIERMLAPQAADRITLPQIMQHRFFLQDISLQDPNLLHLTQLCFKEPSPCALSEQQLKDVVAEVHACLCLRRHTFS